MSPDDLFLIRTDAEHVAGSPDVFSTMFYNTLFDIAPHVRPMFPSDMTDQRRKLMSELTALIGIATDIGHGETGRFVRRAESLGHRHTSYGVENDHYAPVGTALLAALADTVPDWDDQHERTWTTLYRLVADTMRSGPTGHVSAAGGAEADHT